MSRPSDRALRIAAVLMLVVATLGCEQLDGRNRNKKGNRYFRENHFIDAAAEYEKALKQVPEPTIHYNVALAYSKIFKPGVSGNPELLLGEKGTFVCDNIPQVKYVTKQVCVKPGDRRYDACDEKNVCASSYTCKKTELCTLGNQVVADMAAQHWGVWLKAHPDDAETRSLMSHVWIDSDQHEKAVSYWEELLKAKPNDTDIMASLAGINAKAGVWRKSVEWYSKVGDVSSNNDTKIFAYTSIGNVAWGALNKKTLTNADTVELADKGIGALQKAAAIQPKNPKHYSMMASMYNFRSMAMGASWAAGLDRASAQDLQIASRVLSDEAKKAQGLPTTPAPPPAPAPPAAPKDGAGAAQTPTPAKTGG